MIHGADGGKLSKRHGAVNVLEYREMGFLPEALLNDLLRLGWSHGDQEIFTLEEMIGLFDLGAVNSSAANFDPAKLAWVNQQHVLRAPRERLAHLLEQELTRRGVEIANGPPLALTAEALRERSQTLVEMAERARCYYEDFEDFEPQAAQAPYGPPRGRYWKPCATHLRRSRGGQKTLPNTPSRQSRLTSA